MEQHILAIEKDDDVALSSLWLKTITAVDLEVHCINSLIGERLPVDREAGFQRIDLDDQPAQFWYLCSLPSPYRWDLNGHALLVADANAPQVNDRLIGHGVRIHGAGFRVLTPQAGWLRDPGRYNFDRAFTTCRNLQSAHFLADQHGLEDRVNPDRGRYRRPRSRPAAGQTQLFS